MRVNTPIARSGIVLATPHRRNARQCVRPQEHESALSLDAARRLARPALSVFKRKLGRAQSDARRSLPGHSLRSRPDWRLPLHATVVAAVVGGRSQCHRIRTGLPAGASAVERAAAPGGRADGAHRSAQSSQAVLPQSVGGLPLPQHLHARLG